MNCDRKNRRRVLTAVALLAISTATAPGDTLVTTTGQILIGKVARTSTGYSVRPATGAAIEVAAADVKRILMDHSESLPTMPEEEAPPSISPSAAAPGSPVSHGKTDPRTINALLVQGETAFADGAFTDARDSFADALLVDPTNLIAGRGLGFAYLRLNKPMKAAKPLEVAAARSPKLDRSMTVAIAASLLTSHNPMRAVKYIKTYYDSHPTPVDEPMLNALGTVMNQVEPSAKRGSLFQDAAKLYTRLNAELEKARPGQKRWGIEWLDVAEVDSKFKARNTAQAKTDDAATKVQAFEVQIASLKGELSNIGFIGGPINARAAKAQQLQVKINQLTGEQTDAQTILDQRNEELAKTPKPNFPPEIATDGVEFFPDPATASVPAAPTEVASAGGVTNGGTTSSGTTVTGTTAGLQVTPGHRTDGPAKPPTNNTATPPDDAAPPQKSPTSIRHLTRYAVAFAVAPDLLVTASEAVAEASDIHVETSTGTTLRAEVIRTDQSVGLALLRVSGARMPCLAVAPAMTNGGVRAWGFPNVSLFNPVPQMMPCSASAPSANGWSIRFQSPPRLPGGPVLQDGLVVGVEMGSRDSDPAEVPGVPLAALKKLLADDAKPGTPTADAKSAIVQVVADQ